MGCDAHEPTKLGGGERIRTDDILLAKQALYQLSYAPRTDLLSQIVSCATAGSLDPAKALGAD
jgi:hypothetical protein